MVIDDVRALAPLLLIWLPETLGRSFHYVNSVLM
jgi:hypothetical protein